MSALPFKVKFELSIRTASLTVRVPSIRVLPVPFSTLNLSVVLFLTAKSASTSTVLLNSVAPVTVS